MIHPLAGRQYAPTRPLTENQQRIARASSLRRTERQHQQAFQRAEDARDKRNAAVRAAISEGWTHAEIAEATGLTRARVGQIALR